jgi:hypothetical protein
MESSGAGRQRCAYCGAAVPPGGTFCPACGRPSDPSVAQPAWAPRVIEVSLWNAVRLGFGVALGVSMFSLLVAIIVAIALQVSRS